MKLYEYETGKILAESGVRFPDGGVLIGEHNTYDIPFFDNAASSRGLVIKGQMLSGARKKSGAIKFAHSLDEVKQSVSDLLGAEIRSVQNGTTTRITAVLIDKMIPHEKEMYVSFAFDRESERIVLIAACGGTEIESRGKDELFISEICPLSGLREETAFLCAEKLGIPKEKTADFAAFLSLLWKMYVRYDAVLLEINPLVQETGGDFVALDAKMIVDDNALARQPRIVMLRADLERSGFIEKGEEAEAKKIGVGYVKLDGTIGCMVNGAGLAMATMDLLAYHGGKPANFLDVGGGASEEIMRRAFTLLLNNQSVRIVLINILGGILRCDILARAVCDALTQNPQNSTPIIVRFAGTNAEEGKTIFKTFCEASERHVALIEDLDFAAYIAVWTARFPDPQ